MKNCDQRNIRIYLSWLCGQQGISLLPWKTETLAISKNSGKLVFYVYDKWLYSSEPKVFEILEGGFYHEALGHGRNTDFDALDHAEKNGIIKWTQLSRNIQNIFEDIFIELRAAQMYPRVRKALNNTAQILESDGFFGTPETFDKATPIGLLTGALLNHCRAKLLPGQDVILARNVAHLDSILPGALGQIWEQVWDVAKECAHSISTHDNIVLTAKVMRIIESIAKDEPQAHKADEADGNDETESQDSEPSKPSTKEVAAAKAILAAQDQQSKIVVTELSEIVSKAIVKKLLEEGVNSQALHCEINEIPPEYIDVSPNSAKVSAVLRSSSNDLEELLMAKTLTKRELVERGSRIDRASLVRGGAGLSNHIFEKSTIGDSLSTAVYGLFDFSGSMYSDILQGCDSGVHGVNGIAYGLGEILDEFEIPYEWSAFSDQFMTFKSFDQDGSALRRGKKAPLLSGGTATGGATQIALSRLACRTEKRKLLIIATDGDTGDLDLLVSCYNEAKFMGIEIASVMLGPMIPSIKSLAARTGFTAIATSEVSGLGRYVVNRIKDSIGSN